MCHSEDLACIAVVKGLIVFQGLGVCIEFFVCLLHCANFIGFVHPGIMTVLLEL